MKRVLLVCLALLMGCMANWANEVTARAASPSSVPNFLAAMPKCTGLTYDQIVEQYGIYSDEQGAARQLTTDDAWKNAYKAIANGFAAKFGCPAPYRVDWNDGDYTLTSFYVIYVDTYARVFKIPRGLQP